jgi:glycosyl transferase family 4
MPGTMTRSTRVRTSGPTLPYGQDDAEADGALADQHVVLLGTDASPHVTGFPRFTSSLRRLLETRDAIVSTPLDHRPAPVRHRVDLVIAVLPGPGAAAAAVEVANRHDAPMLVLAQGESLPPDMAAARAAHPGAALAARLEDSALSRADRWATLSEWARVRLIGRGVPTPRLDRLAYWTPSGPWLAGGGTAPQAAARRAAARAELGWGDEFVVVAPVGGQLPPALLLAATAVDARTVVLGRGPRVRAVVNGSGQAAVATRGGPGRALELAEFGDDQYTLALAAADVVVVAEDGRADGASAGRLAAALAAGKPVVAAVDAEGHLHADLLRAEGAVLTVPPDDPRRLADALDVLRGAEDARAVMAAGARHYSRVCLAPARAAATLETLAHRAMRTHDLADAPPGPREPGFDWWGRTR